MSSLTNLRNGTEVEDGLVSDARQILNDIWHVSERIHDQFIQTHHSVLPLLWPRQIQQLVSVFAPHLAKHVSFHFTSAAVTVVYSHRPINILSRCRTSYSRCIISCSHR